MFNLLLLILLSTATLSSACDRNPPPATPSANIAQVTSAAFVGPNQAWLVDIQGDQLWRTSDAGKSWDKIPGKTIGGVFRAVTFIDSRRGWAANYEGQIWRTYDGGTTWTLTSQPNSGPDHKPPYLPQQIVFIDETYGWLIDAFSIWRTDDGGSNWTRTLSLTNKLTRIAFIDRNLGWASATEGIVHRTLDGGRTWQSQKQILGDATDIFFVNDHVGWLTGFVSSTQILSGTRLYRTDNGGKTWQPVPIADRDTYMKSVWFTNERQGWAIGHVSKTDRGRGLILHTNDGGKIWQETVVAPDETYFKRMYFVDSKHGWLIAQNHIYRTDDAGNSWQPVLNVTPIQFDE